MGSSIYVMIIYSTQPYQVSEMTLICNLLVISTLSFFASRLFFYERDIFLSCYLPPVQCRHIPTCCGKWQCASWCFLSGPGQIAVLSLHFRSPPNMYTQFQGFCEPKHTSNGSNSHHWDIGKDDFQLGQKSPRLAPQWCWNTLKRLYRVSGSSSALGPRNARRNFSRTAMSWETMWFSMLCTAVTTTIHSIF